MDTFFPSLAANPLQSRADAAALLLALCRPLKPFYSPEKSMLHLGSTAAHYGEKATRMEGWARVLWGLGPLFGGDNRDLPTAMQDEIAAWADVYRTGLVSGTDPESPGYWGDMTDYDQRMVETAALDVALALAPEVLWHPLTSIQQQNVYRWLNQINAHRIHPNNWRFFRILTNMAFARLGLPANAGNLADDFAVIESCYKGDGWYFDGNDGQMDYYIPFAMHFYGLLWSVLAVDAPDAQCAELQQRAARFSQDFIHWFSDDGAEVPFGRSLTYRFAHGAFFSALAFAGVEALPWGAVRHTVLQNLRDWMRYPITDPAGILTIGYRYPDLIMSERYNAQGSPYWAFKTFLFLALPSEHPFWQQAEATFPHPAMMLQAPARILLCHQSDGHVALYPAGQHAAEHGNCAAKYEKFVYSNRFGFSVSRGNALEDGAFDNTLAAAFAGTDFYRMRYGVTGCRVADWYNWTAYALLPGVEVESWVIPCGSDWHIRLHRIETSHPIDVAEGGFALPVEAPFTVRPGRADGKRLPGDAQSSSDGVWATLPWGCAGIFDLPLGRQLRSARMLCTTPNTNLMAPLTAVPILTARLEPGRYWLACRVFGSMAADAAARLANAPTVFLDDGVLTVIHGGRTHRLPLEEAAT